MSDFPHRVGWIGTGRMGFELATRLLKAGVDVGVYNRTRAKAEPLAALGAIVVILVRALNQTASLQASYHSLTETEPYPGSAGLAQRQYIPIVI